MIISVAVSNFIELVCGSESDYLSSELLIREVE